MRRRRLTSRPLVELLELDAETFRLTYRPAGRDRDVALNLGGPQTGLYAIAQMPPAVRATACLVRVWRGAIFPLVLDGQPV